MKMNISTRQKVRENLLSHQTKRIGALLSICCFPPKHNLHTNMTTWLLQVLFGVAWICIPCKAFAPGSRKFRFTSTVPQVSLSSADYSGSNHTARDVMDSLDFIANIHNRGGNHTRGVSLFEATREVEEDEDVLSPPQTTSMEATSMDSQVITRKRRLQ